MATNLTDWSPELLPSIPLLPIQGIKLAVRNAAIDFCKETLLWTYTLDRIDVVEDTQDYTLTIPAAQYGRVISLDDVKYKQDGQDDDQFVSLDIISEEQEDLYRSGNWKFSTGPTPSECWMDNVDKTLHLLPIPDTDSDEGLLVRVNLKPIATADTVPDFIYDDYRNVITEGALFYLFMRRNMPWYDPIQGKECEIKFREKCADAKLRKITGPTKKSMMAQMRYFA